MSSAASDNLAVRLTRCSGVSPSGLLADLSAALKLRVQMERHRMPNAVSDQAHEPVSMVLRTFMAPLYDPTKGMEVYVYLTRMFKGDFGRCLVLKLGYR